MLGAMEKGIKAAEIARPVVGTCDGVDLRTLPKYVCFKAAMLKDRATLHRVLLAMTVAFFGYFVLSRVEVFRLGEALRQKEYILAPGVVDLTPASPRSVPDSYVEHAVIDFLSELGNVNAVNVDEQYGALASFMSPALKVRFEAEASDWKAKVKAEGLTEAITVLSRRIESDANGHYKVTAHVRTDSYIKSEYIGARAEVVEMMLALVPPKDGKRWFLEIAEMTRASADAHKAKENIKQGDGHE